MLTRLHTRYSKETLSEDLIFREAKPVMGGRANWNGTNGDEGAQRESPRRRQQLPGALHHPPLLERAGRLQGARVYDQWGGPPGNPSGAVRADGGQGAGDRAAREGGAAREVRSPVPLLGIPASAPRRGSAQVTGA